MPFVLWGDGLWAGDYELWVFFTYGLTLLYIWLLYNRNAASFGKYFGDKRIDEYGAGKLRIVFTAEDGSFVDASDIDSLKCYVVISQDIAPNAELQLSYETDSKGQEYDGLIKSQNYEEINLIVKQLG